MATLKQLRHRIRSVKSTQQITKAMEMVAAAKLKRAQDRVLASRPYAARIAGMLQSLAGSAASLAHPLFEVRPIERRAVVVIASDKGLCGSYNMNIFRGVEALLADSPPEAIALLAVGRRANQYFVKRPWPMPYRMAEVGDQVDPTKARALALELTRMYLAKEVDLVELAYTQFISTMNRRFRVEPILPIRAAEAEAHANAANYIFEPSPDAIFGTLLPRYVENRVLQAMAESLASEHGARMVSMGAATKNAADVIDHLTLVLNRLRQAAITREISEIVGGADALK
jgi:F-type H+-transporting ATPase subunit gamma